MSKYLIILSFVLTTVSSQAQTAVFRAIQKKYNTAYTAFLYPSTLRALNLAGNRDLDKLIGAVEEAAYLSVDKSQDFVPSRLFWAMSTDLNAAGFTELMSMVGPKQKFAIFSLGQENPNAFVFIMENAENLSMLDIQGAIDLSVISKIDQLDFTSFEDILQQNENKGNASSAD